MTIAAEATTQPERHILDVPADCECGMCAPTWMRRRGKQKRFTEPVTLVEALEREGKAAWPGMVAEHAAYLMAMTSAVARALGELDDDDEPGMDMTGAGLALTMFAAQLAHVVQPTAYRDQLPAGLVAACEQIVTAVALAASGCLTGLLDGFRALQQLAAELDTYSG